MKKFVIFFLVLGSGVEAAPVSPWRALDSGEINEIVNQYEIDLQRTKEAFALLKQDGIDAEAVVKLFTGSELSPGKKLTQLANQIAQSGQAGQEKRNRLLVAYRKADDINDRFLRGLVHAVASLSIAAELLAEVSGSDRILNVKDLEGMTAGAPIDFINPRYKRNEINGAVTLGLLDSALQAVSQSLSDWELGTKGKLQEQLEQLAFLTLNSSTNKTTYTAALIASEVGE